MARFYRPGVLMTAYLVLFVIAGPEHGKPVPATAHQLALDVSLSGIAIGAFLSWRVTRGSSVARGLILLWTVGGFVETFASHAMRSGSLIPAGLLVAYTAQFALLLSTPVYDRTRRNPENRYASPTAVLPAPPKWLLPGAIAIGAILTLLCLGSMDWQPVPVCRSPGYLAPHAAPLAACDTLGQGYPVHYLSAIPSVSLDKGSAVTPSNLDLFANAVIDKHALAEDLALWTLAAGTALYLLWIPQRRPAPSPTAIEEPVPA